MTYFYKTILALPVLVVLTEVGFSQVYNQNPYAPGAPYPQAIMTAPSASRQDDGVNVASHPQNETIQNPGFAVALPYAQVLVTDLISPPANVPANPLFGAATIDDLIHYALENNPELQAKRNRAGAMSARVPQVDSLPDPQLMTTVFLEEIQTAAGPQEVAMSLSQKVPWFGKLNLRGQAAQQDSYAAYARAAAAELKLVEQVKLAYYDLYYLQSTAVESQKLVPLLENVILIATSQYETGADQSGLESLLQAQVELAKLQTTLVGLEESERDAKARLAGELHLPLQDLTGLEAVVPRTNLAHTAETLVGMLDECQPELEARRHEVARDQAAIDLARREYLPDLSLNASWYEMGSNGLSPVANGRDAVSVGVGVNLPIYRRRLDAGLQEARLNRSVSVQEYQAAQDQFRTEIESLYAHFREQDRVLQILESDILPPAEQTVELSTESYRTGRVKFEQMIDSYRTLLNVRIDYHKRLALREQIIASLERAVGCGMTRNPMLEAVSPELPTVPPQ